MERGSRKKHSCKDLIPNAVAMVAPAVVQLTVIDFNDNSIISQGSGTLIDPYGQILTCAHVIVSFSLNQRPIEKGKIKVTLQGGTTFSATVVDVDPYADIALIKIKSQALLPTAKFGISAKLRPGDLIIALGSPESLQNSVTSGIISCIDRKGSSADLPLLEGKYLQVDCDINEGNYGGPLVNIDGEVVGVILKSMEKSQGLNFALPIDSVREVIQYFENHRIVDCSWIGVKVIPKVEESNSSISKGILVLQVEPNSPAHQSGIRKLDVIVELDGEYVLRTDEFSQRIEDKVGKNVSGALERANELFRFHVMPMAVYVTCPDTGDID